MNTADATGIGRPAARETRLPDGRRLADFAPSVADFALSVADAQDVRTARVEVVRMAGEYVASPWVAMTRHRVAKGVRFIAGHGDVIPQVARVAGTTREGLCWQLYKDNTVVSCQDFTEDTRWPRFSSTLAAVTPLRSALAVPLRIDEDATGGLVFYADTPRHFDDDLVEKARVLADQAGLALRYVASRERASGLAVALRTNREIGMALGIVMDRLRVTEGRAFELLTLASQNSHVKLRDIAARLVETGQLPPAAPLTADDGEGASPG